MDAKDIKLGDIFTHILYDREFVVTCFENGLPIFKGISGDMDGRLLWFINLDFYKRTGNILDKKEKSK